MWKKFLASVAIFTLLVTSTPVTHAVDDDQVEGPIADYQVNPDTFDPQSGEDLTVSFDIDRDYKVRVFVIKTDENQPTAFLTSGADNFEVRSFDGNPQTFTWNGRVDNDPQGAIAADGDYRVVTSLREVDGDVNIAGETATFTVQTEEAVNAPEVSALAVNPTAFTPEDGETTNISFTTDETADVTVVVKNGGVTVRTFTGFEGDSKAAGSYGITFNGRDDNNAVLADGTYTVEVTASNSAGSDTETVSVSIEDQDSGNPDVPEIRNLEADPVRFSPVDNEDTEVSFTVTRASFITVVVESVGGSVIRTFEDFDGNIFYQATEDHSINWDGRNDEGEFVEDGDYTVRVTTNVDGNSDQETVAVVVDTDDSGNSDGVIRDVELDPSRNWDPNEEELEIEFDLDADVRSLTIFARQRNNFIEIVDERFVDRQRGISESFDGYDDDGNLVEQGELEIIIRADADTVRQVINVAYERPEIIEAFVTKEEIDPTEDEIAYFVFKSAEEGEATVELFKGSDREMTLVDEMFVKKNRWYAVEIDGKDEDGDDLVFGNDYKVKVEVEHETERGLNDVATVEIDFDEDDQSSSSKRANVTNDIVEPVVFDEDEDNFFTVSYCIDLDAEVTIEIFEDFSTSGSEEITLLDEVEHAPGCHTIQWNGRDDNGKELNNGIYTYKIVSRTTGSRKDTEIGRFVIGNAGEFTDKKDDDDDKPGKKYPIPFPHTPYNGFCGGYWDVDQYGYDSELCQALEWATQEGIFSGYNDGSFRPYDYVNRAETIKVIFEAFDNVTILPSNGSSQGFYDVDAYAWYMPYVRTAKFYGMLHGYINNTEARLNNKVNRVELLKFALEGADAFAGFEKPGKVTSYYADVNAQDPTHDWFFDYAGVAYEYVLLDEEYYGGQVYLNPGDYATRADVAKLLYRMHINGLLDGTWDAYQAPYFYDPIYDPYVEDYYYDYYGDAYYYDDEAYYQPYYGDYYVY